MPAKTAQQIQAEADRMFGKKASNEKFEWRRAQQAAAGLEQEKKKRGGVAGAYDRNKKLVQAAIPMLAGMFVPGAQAGLVGALAGGAARGLDREGKGGIGFDVKQGLKGAVSGFGLGKVGASLGAGAQAARAASGGTFGSMVRDFGAAARGEAGRQFGLGSAGAAGGGSGAGAGAGAAGAGAGGGNPYDALMGGTGSGAGAGSLVGGTSGGGSTLRSLLTNPQVIAGAAGGVADVMGQRSQQRIAEQQMEQQGEQFQQRFNAEDEERKRQQAQANRLAGFFMPRAQG